MASIIGKWRNMTGRRYTNPSDLVYFIVEAYAGANPGSENGITGVVFFVSDSDGNNLTIPVTERSWLFPNYSTYTSTRLNGVVEQMTPVWAYGFFLPLASMGAGAITVTAAVAANNGAYIGLADTIKVYNDTAGGDSRPCTKTIYVNSATGSDSNDGSIGAPVATIQKAVQRCRKNTSGTTMADADCGGATIILSDHEHIFAGSTSYDNTYWHTSDHWWLQIVSPTGNAILKHAASADGFYNLYPQSYLFARGWQDTPTGAPYGNVRIQISNCKLVGPQGAVRVGNGGATTAVNCHVWIDGGESYSGITGLTNHTVMYWAKEGLTSSEGNLAKMYCSGHYRHNVQNGFVGFTQLIDCKLSNYLGWAMQASGTVLDATNMLIEHQHAYNNSTGTQTDGYVWVTDGAKLQVTKPGAGLMRVDSTASLSLGAGGTTANGFSTHFAHILNINTQVGYSSVGVGFSGFSSSGNNGLFPIVATGTNGNGTEYVICQNANAVAQLGTAGTQMFTATLIGPSVGQWNAVIHPDVLQWNTNTTGSLCSSIAIRDVKESQIWFSAGHTLTNCWLVNVTDGGGSQINNFANNSSFIDCGFFNNTFSYVADFGGTGTRTNNSFVDNVFYKTGNIPAHGTTATSNYFAGNHWIIVPPVFGADAPRGVSYSSGTWFDGDPGVDPWYFTPASGNLGTGVGLLPTPTGFEWPGTSAPTKGCWINVGEYDNQSISDPATGGTPVTITADTITATLNVSSVTYERGILPSVVSAALAIFPASVTNPHLATVTPVTASISQLDVSADVTVNANATALLLRSNVFSATVKWSQSIDSGSVIDLAASQFDLDIPITRLPVIDLQHMSIRSYSGFASVFTDIEADSLALSATLYDPVIFKTINVDAVDLQSLTITAVPQPQDTYATNHAVPGLTITQVPQTVTVGSSITGSVIDMVITALDQPQDVEATGQTQNLIATLPDVRIADNIYATSPIQRLSMVQLDAYGSNPGTVKADVIDMKLLTVIQQVNITARADSGVQYLSLITPDADTQVNIAVNIDVDSQDMIIFAVPAESATEANVLVDMQPMTSSILVATATSGTSVDAPMQLMSIDALDAQVGYEASVNVFTQFLSVAVFDVDVVIPANVDADVQDLAVQAPVILADTSVEATTDSAASMQLELNESYGLGKVTLPTVAEIPTGLERELLNPDIPAILIPDEEWRIVQTD